MFGDIKPLPSHGFEDFQITKKIFGDIKSLPNHGFEDFQIIKQCLSYKLLNLLIVKTSHHLIYSWSPLLLQTKSNVRAQ